MQSPYEAQSNQTPTSKKWQTIQNIALCIATDCTQDNTQHLTRRTKVLQ